jgi:hypothetical protein
MAYPDQEAKRLEKAVLDLPIDADGLTEGKAERLPKQISRHLLPEKEDRDPKMLIETVVANFFEDLGSTKRREASNIASPTLSRHSPIAAVRTTNTRQQRPVEIHQATASPPQSKQIERERKPYSGAPSVPSNVSTSSNEDGSVKTERERQPYTAQPSCCKVYTDGRSLNSGPRLGRTNSTSQRRETPDDRLPSENRTQCNARQTYARGQSFSEREKYRGAPAEDWYREPPKGRGYEENRY